MFQEIHQDDNGGTYKSVSPRDIDVEFIKGANRNNKKLIVDNYFTGEDDLFSSNPEHPRKDTERELMGTKITQGNFEEKKRRFDDIDDDDLQFSFNKEKEFARRGGGIDSDDDIDNIPTTGKKLKGQQSHSKGMGGKNLQRNLDTDE